MSEELGTYHMQWQTHGFKPSDLSDFEWEQVTSEFIRLYNAYCEVSNGKNGYDRINKEFDRRYGSMDRSIDGLEAYTYGTFVAWRLNELLYISPIKFQSALLEPYIFMDGWYPIFGARLKDHEGYSMDFSLKPEESKG